MKGKKCLNLLSRSRVFSASLLLLLSLLFSLFPVNKANALDYNINLNYIKDLQSGEYNFYYKYGLNGTLRSYSGRTLSIHRYGAPEDDVSYLDNVYIRYMCTKNSFTFKTGDIVELTFFTSAEGSHTSIGGITGYYGSDNFAILDIQQELDNGNVISKLKKGVTQVMPGSNETYIVEELYYPFQLYSYNVILKAASSGTYPVCLGRSSGNNQYNLYEIPPTSIAAGYEFKMSANYVLRQYSLDTSSEDMNEKDEEDRENIENQQSDSQDSSDDSQEEAESTGTTLLAAFSSFVTAITNASPSNCNLLMNMGNLNLGNVNLCQLSPPPEFQAIASIFLILFCVPLSIATARKVINLFRSFQS